MLGEGRARLPFLPPSLPATLLFLPGSRMMMLGRATTQRAGAKVPARSTEDALRIFPPHGMSPGGDTVSHHPWQGPTVLSPRPAHPSCPKVMFSLKRRLSSRSSCVMWHHFSLQGTSPFGTTVPPQIPCIPLSMSPRARGHLRARWLPERAPCWMGSGAHASTQPVNFGAKKEVPGDEVLFS